MPWCGTRVDVRLTASTVEIFQRASAWPRSRERRAGGPHHRHGPHAAWPPAAPGLSPARLIAWAADDRVQTAASRRRSSPTAATGAGLPLLPRGPWRLAKRDGRAARAACARALAARALVPARRCDLEARPRPLSAAGRERGHPRPPLVHDQLRAHLLPVKEALDAQPPDDGATQTLKLGARSAAWTAQQQAADLAALSFDERFGLLVEAEWCARENARLTRHLQAAKLKLGQACLEALDYAARRDSTSLCSASSPPAAGWPSTSRC